MSDETGNALDRVLEKLQRTIENNPRTDDAPLAKQLVPKATQLPFWPDPMRGAPNALLRSAFFAAIHSKKRRELGERISPDKPKHGTPIATQEGIRISFAGDQLNQYDADVFFEALHRAQGNPLPTECLFTGYDFLKAIGRSDAKGNYEDLDNSLRRLRDGRIEIDWKTPSGKSRHYEGGLLADFVREENSKLYKVTFTQKIRDLFAPACWTQLEWEERMALKGKPLAQWLHSFYCTHAKPFPLTTAYLHEKTGSQRTVLKFFRRDLKNALVTLEKILGWQARWEGDLLAIMRRPSASQIRHLNQKQGRRHKQQRRQLTRVADLFG